MTPGEASASGIALEILHPLGGKRVCAQVFDIHGGGAAFVDSGWTDPLSTSHMGHLVPGSFHQFDNSWGPILPEGDCFFLERPDLKPEGDRDLERRMLQDELSIKLCEIGQENPVIQLNNSPYKK